MDIRCQTIRFLLSINRFPSQKEQGNLCAQRYFLSPIRFLVCTAMYSPPPILIIYISGPLLHASSNRTVMGCSTVAYLCAALISEISSAGSLSRRISPSLSLPFPRLLLQDSHLNDMDISIAHFSVSFSFFFL